MQTIPVVTSLQMEDCRGRFAVTITSHAVRPVWPFIIVSVITVTTLEEAARGILKSKDLSELLQRLKDTSTINQTLIKDKRENIKALEDQKTRIEKELQNARQRVIENFDKQHSTFMKKISQKHNTKIEEMTDSIKEIENRDKAIQNCTNLIEVSMTRSSETHVFLEMKKVIEKEEEQINALEQIQTKHKR
ncbi:hypothetical protein KUTeg_012812 [Tegillarca granosa]|uniref:Uncharacterized protein n=1 Tax=Tegillarca granosa TaxID=220873 RepID=A0ABQ9EWW2_TEGGR|nr:hypothetical protein KUTeg_012812 [Tegillarca granosa]